MAPGSFRFDAFLLDPADRQLRRGDEPVELNGRYLDALALRVREQGRLVSKDRFLEEVWQGVPVTDEALTQCIKTLRRQLGDDAASPRFIETVPKHGYRFIAPVEAVRPVAAAPWMPKASPRDFLLLGAAGTLGGGLAGLLGGVIYGFAVVSQPLQVGMGAASVMLVLVCVTLAVGLMGGAGVGFGIAASTLGSGRLGPWSIAGGAFGGMAVGAVVKLLGHDAFNLLVGRSPGDVTGASEGLILGAGVGLGAWLASRMASRQVALAGLCGGAAGLLIPLIGGRLMGGSLDLLARRFPGSQLRLDQIGALFGERAFGPLSQALTGALEGMLFGACVVGAMLLARRRPE